MKHAILGPKGRIIFLKDTADDNTVPLTQEQTALVEENKGGYFIIDGTFMTAAERFQQNMDERLSPEQRAARAARLQNKQVYDIAAAEFAQLSKGKQVLWEQVRIAVGKAIMSGDIAAAKEILETMPSLYTNMSADRNKFLALFP